MNTVPTPPTKRPKPPFDQPNKFYWAKCYETVDRTHWALCDHYTDASRPPGRVTCLALISIDSWSTDFPNQPFPKRIVEMLNQAAEEEFKKTTK